MIWLNVSRSGTWVGTADGEGETPKRRGLIYIESRYLLNPTGLAYTDCNVFIYLGL